MARLFNLDQPRILSRPHSVRFFGWVSDTYSLQRNGWQIAAQEEFYGDRLRLLLRHPKLNIDMITGHCDMDFQWYSDQRLEFEVVRAGAPLRAFAEPPINLGDMLESPFKQIDAKAQYVKNFEPKSIEDFGIFAAQLVRTEEILIEPQSVAECMEYIKRLQAPELAAIRERNRRRERQDEQSAEPVLRQIFHAQILSIAA